MESNTFEALAMVCATAVHLDTARALVSIESGFNPYAIGVTGGSLEHQPRHHAEAVATARSLQSGGWNFSVGLGQINVRQFKRLGLVVETALDPCTNLAAMQSVLIDCFSRAAPSDFPVLDDQARLRRALSCYYSGNFINGFQHGYVRKVVTASWRRPSSSARAAAPRQSPKEKK